MNEDRRAGWAVAGFRAAAALLAAPSVAPGDPERAALLAEYAETVSPDDPTAPVWVDVHLAWSDVRPWQREWGAARQARARIEAERRALLRSEGGYP